MHLHENGEQYSWYALQVTTRKEAVVSTILTGKGYECYLPLYPKRRMWSDRVKVTLAPVFSGYVFTRFDVRHRLPILVTENVQGIVGAGKLPIAIPDREVDQIRKALQSGMPVEPCDQLREGDAVRVICGPLNGRRYLCSLPRSVSPDCLCLDNQQIIEYRNGSLLGATGSCLQDQQS